jgi:hypothetical protein
MLAASMHTAGITDTNSKMNVRLSWFAVSALCARAALAKVVVMLQHCLWST